MERRNNNQADTFFCKVLSGQNNRNTYIPIKKLGSGSYGSVWMCYSVQKKKLMAIKIFKDYEQKSGKKETDIYNKFNKLGIKNITKMHDNFMYEENMCLVFDLMIGSLYDVVRKGRLVTDNSSFKMGYPINFVIKAVRCILETLVDLHNNGILHGDVKPENILLFGRTKFHDELVSKLEPKSSTKKMIEAITNICNTKIKNNELRTSDIENSRSRSNSYSDDDDSRSDHDKHGAHNGTNDSDMSNAPRKIVLSDSDDSNSDEDDDDDKDGHKTKKPIMEIDVRYINDPIFKVADLGSCVDLKSDKKPIGVQTKYYKSPEILLGLSYNEMCDMWALGCSIYELLTGELLFDPDDFKIDKKRCILNQICASLGRIPNEMVEASPYKQVFFTHDNIVKGSTLLDNEFYESNIWIDLLEHINKDTSASMTQKYLLVDLMMEMLKIDPKKRISAHGAMDHPLFKLY
jgi:serine/threonine-protein kinase SRPK3